MKGKTAIIFGVFDKLHEGHRFLLDEAKKYGEVTAIVARDMAVLRLKGHFTLENEVERVENLKKLINSVELGDEEDGKYNVLKNIFKKNENEKVECVICFGYDQIEFKKDIEKKIKDKVLPKIELVVLPSFKPEIYHSSLLN